MLVITNPASHVLVARIEEDSESFINAEFQRLKAYDFSAAHDLAARKQALLSAADAMLKEQEGLARLLSQEMGKPITQARAEIADTASRMQFVALKLASVGDQRTLQKQPHLTEAIRFEPLGVVLCISAWNYPYFVSTNVIIPALLAGCRVMFKPSELAMLSGIKLVEILQQQPALKDAITVIKGGKDIGKRLVQLPFDGIFFTGSEPAGFAIKADIGSRMIRSQFELGGKDAAYICDDSDLERAVRAVVSGAFYNCGQSCCSIERIYVHQQVAAQFKDMLSRAVANLVIGDPQDDATFIGPLTRPEQINLLERQIACAQEKGAEVLCGGQRASMTGNYFLPTVIWNANDAMEVMREESFGPIVGVEIVDSDEEAITKINASRFGLTAAVFTRDEIRAELILSQLDVGTVYWNCCDRVSPRLPWSGRKHSGMGVTLSTLGMEMFYKPKAWFMKPAS